MPAVDPTIVSSVGVLAGVVVGLGAPAANARSTRRAARHTDERSVAERLLDAWSDEPDVLGALRDDTSRGRRSVLLFGLRLKDDAARRACLHLLTVAGSDADDGTLLDAWTDMIEAIARVYRATG